MELADWPFLPPPDSFGELTAPRLEGIPDADLAVALEEWPRSVWGAWADHQIVVRQWAGALRERRWRR
jgi:hypothetical protein